MRSEDFSPFDNPAVTPVGINTMQSRKARAELRFTKNTSGNTFISHQHAEHPFHITRPYHYERDPEGMVTLYLQSSSGGIYRGDDLSMDVLLEEQAQLHLTTQASTIVHNTRGIKARQSVDLVLGKGSYCEYIPDPTVLFSGAAFCSNIQIKLGEGSKILFTDSFMWHDPSYKLVTEQGEHAFAGYDGNIKVVDQHMNLLVLERFRLEGKDVLQHNCAIHDSFRAQGSLFIIDQSPSLNCVLGAIREGLSHFNDIYAGASELPNNSGIIIRFLAKDGIALQKALNMSWSISREQLTGTIPKLRRK